MSNWTINGKPAKKFKGGIWAIINSDGTYDATHPYHPSDLDIKIGKGNKQKGRIYKKADGKWYFDDGTLVTSFSNSETSINSQPKTVVTASKPSNRSKTTTKPKPTAISPITSKGYTFTPIKTNEIYGENPFAEFLKDNSASKLIEETFNEFMPDKEVLDNNTNVFSAPFDREWVKANRNLGVDNSGKRLGYGNVNEFMSFLTDNPESEEARLLRQNGYTDINGNLDYNQILQMLTQQGIRGNLGRRDSRRLGNVLTRLRDQSTYGTEANNQFIKGAIDQYNQNYRNGNTTLSFDETTGNIVFDNLNNTPNVTVNNPTYRTRIANFLKQNKDIFDPYKTNPIINFPGI